MAKRNKQTGTPNPKNYTKGSSRLSKTMNPWGKPVARKAKGLLGRVSGSSVRKSRSAPELAPQTRGYPKNQPSQWPVMPDYVNHTRTPSLSGVNNTTAASHNAAVERAYTRAGYQ